MKNIITSTVFLIGVAVFTISCSNKEKKSSEKDLEESLDSIKKDSIKSDTFKMIPGEIPEGWKKVSLDKGYYIAFPKKPWRRAIPEKNRVEFHYPQKNYDTYVSLTDLEKEPVLKNNKENKKKFFNAVIKDLLADLTESSDQKETPQIIKQEDFLFQNIYEGIKIELEALDVHIFIQCVVMGKMLCTVAVLIWEDETPNVLRAKDRFFNSLGKELQVE
jgi:hypothetical protein